MPAQGYLLACKQGLALESSHSQAYSAGLTLTAMLNRHCTEVRKQTSSSVLEHQPGGLTRLASLFQGHGAESAAHAEVDLHDHWTALVAEEVEKLLAMHLNTM